MKNEIHWRGIIVPAVTPMKDPYTVDLPAVQKHFDYMIAGGVNGIFILGTTGEGPAIGHGEQRKFIRESVKAVAGRVPLLVGISEASGADTLEMGQFALEAMLSPLGYKHLGLKTPTQYVQPDLLEETEE